MVKRTLLMADPDADAREVFAQAAKRLGFSPVFAADEGEAQKRFVEAGPEAVFADMLLPRRGPFDFLKRVRTSKKGGAIPVFVTNALHYGAGALEQLADEVDARILPKPLDADKLADALTVALGGAGGAPEAPPVWLLAGAVAPEGSFNRHSFPLVFAHALYSRAPLRLALARGDAKKILTIAPPNVEFALSNVFSETLARHLLARGLVTEADYRSAVAIAADTGGLIGEAFLSMESLTPEALDAALRRNALDKVQDLFTWQAGRYRFLPYEPPPAALPGGPLNGEELLWSVIRERIPANEIARSFRHFAGAWLGPLRPGRPASELPGAEVLGRSDAAMLRALAGAATQRPLADIVERSSPDELALIYFLLLTRVLQMPADTRVPPADPAAREKLAEIEERCEWLKSANAFQALGVATDAGDAQIEGAFQKLRSELGPDAVAKLPREARRQAFKTDEAYRLVKSAYKALQTAKARKSYLSTLGDFDFTVGDEARQFKAENVYREGLEAFAAMNWAKAFDRFTAAAKENPAEAEYLLSAGIARRHMDTPTREEALIEAAALVSEAAERQTKSAEPHYHLGRIREALGEMEEAMECYAAALLRDPEHERTRKRVKFLAAKSPLWIADRLKKLLPLG